MAEQSAEEMFVDLIWSQTIAPADDSSWVNACKARDPDERPLGDKSGLVRRMLDLGLTEQEVARFARIVAYETAFGICDLLDEGGPDDDTAIGWGLFRVDPDTEEPLEPMWGTHELILSADPTGDEMRPPG